MKDPRSLCHSCHYKSLKVSDWVEHGDAIHETWDRHANLAEDAAIWDRDAAMWDRDPHARAMDDESGSAPGILDQAQSSGYDSVIFSSTG